MIKMPISFTFQTTKLVVPENPYWKTREITAFDVYLEKKLEEKYEYYKVFPNEFLFEYYNLKKK